MVTTEGQKWQHPLFDAQILDGYLWGRDCLDMKSGIAMMLLPDKKVKLLGVPKRMFIAIAGSAFCVFVEYALNSVGPLTWDYSWWGQSTPWPIFLIGYLTFFIAAIWVFDMKSIKNKLIAVGSIWAVDILALILFIPVLRWI